MNAGNLSVLIWLLIAPLAISCRSRGEQHTHLLLAFQQQDDADIVAGFYTWNSITLLKPLVTKGNEGKFLKDLGKADLLEILRTIENKQLAVVILSKLSDPDGKSQALIMDEIEVFMAEAGFRRVVFQQDLSDEHPDGLPILRDKTF